MPDTAGPIVAKADITGVPALPQSSGPVQLYQESGVPPENPGWYFISPSEGLSVVEEILVRVKYTNVGTIPIEGDGPYADVGVLYPYAAYVVAAESTDIHLGGDPTLTPEVLSITSMSVSTLSAPPGSTAHFRAFDTHSLLLDPPTTRLIWTIVYDPTLGDPPIPGDYEFLLTITLDTPVAGAGLWGLLGSIYEVSTAFGHLYEVTEWSIVAIDDTPPDPGQTPALGPINMDVPLLEFEPARAAHVWMKPQRTNMVANPSFEVGTEGEGNAATVAFSRLAHGDAGGDPDVTIDLTAGTFGMGTFGSGTFGDPGELDADVWMVAFNAAGANPKNYDLLDDPWFTFRSDGWVVGLTTVQPSDITIRSLADGIEKTGEATGTEPIGEWDLYYFGLNGVDLTGDDSLTVVNDSEFNTGIVGFGFWTNADGGTSVSSAPFLPQAGAHTDGQFVVQIAGRWLPGAATNMEVRLANADVWSVGGLPDPTTPGNEHSITEIMSFEFLSTPLAVAFGWRTDGDISVVHSGTLSNPGPTPIGPAPRTKTAHLTGGTEVEYVPAYTTVDDEGDPVEVPAIMGNRIVLESNMFPTAVSQDQFMSLEAQVAGEGQVRIGLVTWNPAKLIPTYTAGPWVLLNSATAFQPVQALIALPDQADEATFRLEFRGDECWVDNVLVDNNAAQLGYFDGSWHTGREGDFSWYGQWGYTGAIDGTVNPTEALHNIKHRSYSLYYNDRDNTDAWLFGYTEPLPKEGKLYELSPYAEVDAPVVWIDENASIEEGRQALIDNGTAGGTLGITRQIPDDLAPGQLVSEELGQLSLAALTTMTRVGGEAWGWVPEGADVIPQWDDVYGLRVPCWPGELFVPVKDVSGMPVTQL